MSGGHAGNYYPNAMGGSAVVVGPSPHLYQQQHLGSKPANTQVQVSTSGAADGPLCASSPKRAVSAFTTFGQNGGGRFSNAGSSSSGSPAPNPPNSTPIPTTGHLV